jgi:hypothetical protein
MVSVRSPFGTVPGIHKSQRGHSVIPEGLLCATCSESHRLTPCLHVSAHLITYDMMMQNAVLKIFPSPAITPSRDLIGDECSDIPSSDTDSVLDF